MSLAWHPQAIDVQLCATLQASNQARRVRPDTGYRVAGSQESGRSGGRHSGGGRTHLGQRSVRFFQCGRSQGKTGLRFTSKRLDGCRLGPVSLPGEAHNGTTPWTPIKDERRPLGQQIWLRFGTPSTHPLVICVIWPILIEYWPMDTHRNTQKQRLHHPGPSRSAA